MSQRSQRFLARMAGAAAVLIAVSGLLVRAMNQKAKRLHNVRNAVKQVKNRVKARVRNAAKTVVSGARSARRAATPRLALAGSVGRSGSKNR